MPKEIRMAWHKIGANLPKKRVHHGRIIAAVV
jgi:hypothetical protein